MKFRNLLIGASSLLLAGTISLSYAQKDGQYHIYGRVVDTCGLKNPIHTRTFDLINIPQVSVPEFVAFERPYDIALNDVTNFRVTWTYNGLTGKGSCFAGFVPAGPNGNGGPVKPVTEGNQNEGKTLCQYKELHNGFDYAEFVIFYPRSQCKGHD